MQTDSWTRRRFLQVLAASGAAGILPAGARASSKDPIRISILHTTDLHGHILPTVSYEGEKNLGGFARCATQIRTWRLENPHSLLIDVGDVFQGTEIGLRTQGQVMLRAFELLGYDGWVIGNHEFDWGPEPLERLITTSPVPALCANARLEGAAFERVKPWILREVAGIRIGILGLTTPGLPYWLQPELTKGFEATDPAPAAAAAVAELRDAGADAIVIAAHMGTRSEGDNFANRIEAIARAVPDAAVILAGHTHRDIPSSRVRGVLYTQANYHGLNVGKTDLFFDPDSKRLLAAEASTVRMGDSVTPDPVVLSSSARDLEDSRLALAAKAGSIKETLSARSQGTVPSDVQRLIGTSIFQCLASRGVRVDGVLHGSFAREDIAPGDLRVGDCWKIIPYENFVLLADFSPSEMALVLGDAAKSGGASTLALLGCRPDDPNKRYRIAMNSYDAASAGQRLPKLREIVRSKHARSEFLRLQTRELLIEFLAKHTPGGVGRSDLISA